VGGSEYYNNNLSVYCSGRLKGEGKEDKHDATTKLQQFLFNKNNHHAVWNINICFWTTDRKHFHGQCM